MYVVDDIAYAGEPATPLKVVGVRALDDRKLWLRFSTHETKIFDMNKVLGSPAFQDLNDPNNIKTVYLDYGVPTWLNGKIDLAPEMLYEQSVPCA